MFKSCGINLLFLIGIALAVLGLGYSERMSDPVVPDSGSEEVATMTLELTSSAFADGEAIPARYTCTGDDISPALQWRGVPEGSRSLALIMDDPDAPGRTWVHWVVYNLPPDTTGLPEAIRTDDDLPGEAAHGRNSWGRNDYGGPCPPGGTHRYFFKLYALDTRLDLPSGATKQDVLDAMKGHILAEAQWMGTYQK